jgi:hypothetical protein
MNTAEIVNDSGGGGGYVKGIVFAALLGALVFCAACEQEPPDTGEGAGAPLLEPSVTPPEDSILIGSEADLKNIGSAGYPLNGNYALTADLTLDGWTPICQTNPFTGAFYGQNHTITITNGSGGIFAFMGVSSAKTRALARDLRLNITAVRTGGSIGGITGSAVRSRIENCAVEAVLTLTGTDHNAAAGGIIGTMGDHSIVSGCTASGTITLESGLDAGFMVYSGGIAGYSGTPGLAGDGESGCVIEKSRWTGSAVTAQGGYPYAGGVVGYNYTGAKVSRCSSQGAVTARGGNLPYAGGVAGYNSGYVNGKGTPSTIENCYSTAAVLADSSSKAALAGGVAGANAKGALISKCYAAGAVTARVAGSGAADFGGSIGPPAAASAGGIAGAQYYFEKSPAIEYCAALNSSVNGEDTATGAVWNTFRVAGAGAPDNDNTTTARVYYRNNIAYSGMSVPRHAASWNKTAAGRDGADCAAKPGQQVFKNMGWDFDGGGVWTMSGEYPALR